MFFRSYLILPKNFLFKQLICLYSVQSEGIPLQVGDSASIPLGGKDRKVSAQVEDLVNKIANLPLLEVSDLNYALKKRLNISDVPFMSTNFSLPTTGQAAAPCKFFFC